VRPVKPRTTLNLALAAALGSMFAFAVAFFAEYMDDTIRTPEQVEQSLGVPVFALIPSMPARAR
jgi:capsular polysaccharide biosynthesis protein